MSVPALSEVPALAVDVAPNASPLWWDRAIFFSLDTDDQHCPEVFDLTGAPRYLLYGPYRRLEPGLWRAVVPLELCLEAGRRQLAVEFGVEPNYSIVNLPYGVPGRHDIQLDFRVVEAGVAQVRVWLRRAAFHGQLRFTGASIQKIGEVEAVGEPG